jgi:hypothetical protein
MCCLVEGALTIAVKCAVTCSYPDFKVRFLASAGNEVDLGVYAWRDVMGWVVLIVKVVDRTGQASVTSDSLEPTVSA